MRIVLREDIDKLGRRGEVVKVADGYARNFLLPKGKALPATEGNMTTIEREKRRYVARQAKEKDAAEGLARRLAGVSCTIVRKVGENEVLYGSVTAADVAEYLEKEGITVDKRRIQLEEPIRSLGIYNVPVRIHADVTAEVKVWVVKE
ncbi:MAG TPA: 50S ribosomal protein L9 [Candidatus Polarisedimenticolia bacterium]|nr:50S ribosomal protein L9 [Candidatus Polarisedimenticolia bacterium]